MKRNLTILLLLTILLSCEEEKNDSDSYLWTPKIHLEKGDKQATLSFIDPRPFTDYFGPGPSNPDYFEVLISEDNTRFTLYSKVDVSTASIAIQDLTNGKPYYIKVTSLKDKYDSKTSNTVMTVPSEEPNIKLYNGNMDYSIEKVSTSFDMSYVSFISNHNTGQDVLYYKAIDSDTIKRIEENSYGVEWSKTTNTLVYLTSIKEGNMIYPNKLKIFETETLETKTLLEVPYDMYYIMNPKFTPKGELISFLSSENNSEKYIYDLWSYNPSSKKKTKITNFEAIGFLINSEYDWSISGEEFYMDGRYNTSSTSNNIYKINTKTMTIIPIIESSWNDRNPSLSPDMTKLLFVSDRSGKNEVWQYQMDGQKLMQITGGNAFYFDARYSNIQWLNNKELLITAFEDTKSKAIKVTLP